jgi:hypothetical protein
MDEKCGQFSQEYQKQIHRAWSFGYSWTLLLCIILYGMLAWCSNIVRCGKLQNPIEHFANLVNVMSHSILGPRQKSCHNATNSSTRPLHYLETKLFNSICHLYKIRESINLIWYNIIQWRTSSQNWCMNNASPNSHCCHMSSTSILAPWTLTPLNNV